MPSCLLPPTSIPIDPTLQRHWVTYRNAHGRQATEAHAKLDGGGKKTFRADRSLIYTSTCTVEIMFVGGRDLCDTAPAQMLFCLGAICMTRLLNRISPRKNTGSNLSQIVICDTFSTASGPDVYPGWDLYDCMIRLLAQHLNTTKHRV